MPGMTDLTETQRILAIEEIKQLKARYFRCMDKKDWAGYLAVFTPDAIVDSTEAFTPTDHTGAPMNVGGAPPAPPNPDLYNSDIVKFVADLSAMLGPVSTVHHGHMPEIELLSPTTARGTWSMEDMLRFPEGSPTRTMHGFGHYEETYERLAEGWRIKSTKLTRLRVDTTS
jgi:hypothetical protein